MRQATERRKEEPPGTIEQQLIGLLAGTAARRRQAQPQIEALARDVDWKQAAEQLASARLLPTLGGRLIECGGGAAEAALGESVADTLAESRRRDALLRLVGDRTIATLGENGIVARPLKGPWLGERLYGEPGRRLSGDIDLLVGLGQVASAVAAVRRLGYLEPADQVDARGLPLLHFSLLHEQGQLPAIEIHWRIHWYESSFAAERLLPPAGATQGWEPELADELASLLLFYARDGFSSLRQATDLAAWWDRFGDDLQPGALERVAARYPPLRPSLAAAAVVAHRRVGLPEEILAHPRQRLTRRERVAVRLADPRPYASREQLFAEVGLVDGLLTPTGGLPAFFRRQVAPPAGVIREHADKAGREDAGSSLGYSARMITRYLLALGRLARVPGTRRARFGPEAGGA